MILIDTKFNKTYIKNKQTSLTHQMSNKPAGWNPFARYAEHGVQAPLSSCDYALSNFEVADEHKPGYVPAYKPQDPEEVTLTFSDIVYTVHVKNNEGNLQKRDILKGVSGICRPGQLTAIMGPSGGGKTTLLNLLACRIVPDNKKSFIQGNFLANGKIYNSETFSKFAGYLMQDDILFETQTPREAIQFAADLRMQAFPEQRKARVEQLLSDFQLKRAADTYIGGIFMKGISGGERKRTSLALELVSNPSVLLLDEPTSGLDSFTAFVLINLLKNLANKGKNIIFTIHQPSSDIFCLFDQLMLISDGKFIYQGDAAEGTNYFASIGHPCPEYANPADHYIQITHTYDRENLYESYNRNILPSIRDAISESPCKDLNFHQIEQELNYCSQKVAYRAIVLFFRHPVLFKARLLMIILIAVLMISLYAPLDDENTPAALFDRTGALYFYTLANFLVSLMGTALTFPVERPVFLREQNSKIYPLIAYFLGRQAVDIPLSIFSPALLALLIYYFLGFNTYAFSNFLYFVMVSVFLSLSAGGFGLLVGSFLTNPITAATSVSALTIPFNIVSGYYINVKNIPFYIAWLQYFSPVRYGIEALMWNEYDYPGSKYGQAPLDTYNYAWGFTWTTLGLIGLTILFRFLSYKSLQYVSKTTQ